MAITAHKLRRCEIWSTWVAGGGVRQAIVDVATVLTATSNIAGSDNLDLTLPLVSAAAPYVVPNAVIRVEEADGVFDEWLILEGPNDDDGNGLRTVKALSIRAAMAKCEFVRRIDSDGVSVLDFESVGLTPAQQIAAWVVPALTRGGMGWAVAGTITPTKLLDLTFASDTPLSVLQRIAEQTGMELEVRRTGDTGYAIDIIAEIGSAQPTADLRFDKNLRPGTKRNRSSLESATRVYPIGADEDGRRATMSRATWLVTNIAGLIVTLADPAGGAGPIQFDGQLAGADGTTAAYLRKPNGTLTAVTASSFANQTVTVASAANLAINDLAQFRADSAGADLLWLDSPPDRALYGLSVGKVEMSDVPSTNNLLKNSVMRSWPGSASVPPPNWTKLGGGTVDRQAASPYTRSGGFSIHRVGVADGDGVVSDAVSLIPTALRPYISGYAGLWVVSGQVRVELVFTTGGGPMVQPLPPDFATNSGLGQWEELGLSGIDANALGATAVAIRVVQHGAIAADFYLDYGQVTESPSQLPLAESSGGTRLWQAANEALRTKGTPVVSYVIQIVDLANIDPVTWGADCKVQVGGKVRVTDPRLSIAITTRLVELQRDYRVPGDTKVTLSNKPDDMTGTLARPKGPGREVVGGTGPTAAGYQTVLAKLIASLNPGTYPDAQYATIVVTSDNPTATVQFVGVTGAAALASGAAIGVARAQDGTGNVWVFSRAVINAGQGQAQFRAVALGEFDDDGFAVIEEQGRDTVSLVMEMKAIAGAPADFLRVRIVVADPFPQGANTINVTLTLLGLPGPVVLAGTSTDFGAGRLLGETTALLATAAFIDVDVPQPGTLPGRASARATAANRTQAVDALDVAPSTVVGPTGPQGSMGPTGVQGIQGVGGVTGPQGPLGPTGTQGPQGVGGVTGPQGPLGPTGTQGAQGPGGVTGPQGTQGPAGVTGPQGAQGVGGVTGPQGTAGATGVQGVQGVQGAAGVTGVQGPSGAAGPTGTEGPQGLLGVNWRGAWSAGNNYIETDLIQHEGASYVAILDHTSVSYPPSGRTVLDTSSLIGKTYLQDHPTVAGRYVFGTLSADATAFLQGHATVSGRYVLGNVSGDATAFLHTGNRPPNLDFWNLVSDKGQIGVTGPTGPQGVVGPTGVQGIQGIQGAVGVTGAGGAQGSTGVQGTQGIQGVTGVQGTQGIAGATGVQGTQGIQGVTGVQGAQGSTGVQGTQGIQGVTGVQGSQGVTGVQGVQGAQGVTGVAGSAGPTGAAGPTGPAVPHFDNAVCSVFHDAAGDDYTVTWALSPEVSDSLHKVQVNYYHNGVETTTSGNLTPSSLGTTKTAITGDGSGKYNMLLSLTLTSGGATVYSVLTRPGPAAF